MIAQNLKKSILQEAISGRLVSQIESEGTADDLLQQIAKEHREAFLAQQAKEKAEAEANGKKFTPKKYVPLTFSVISEDEQPFEIPNSWRWVRLGEIVSILGDGIHGTPTYDDYGDYYFINGNNLLNGKILIKQDTKKVNESEYKKYRKNLNENTVFVSINGTLGNIAFYNNEKVILGKSACYFNLYVKDLKFYIFYLVKTKYFLDYVEHTATGSTIKNVSLAAMRNLLIPLPPLSEQRRIVSKLESLLPKIDSLSETETRLSVLESTLGDRLWKSVLQEAIAGRLTTQLESDGTADILLDQIKAAHREAFDAEQAKDKAAAEKSGKKFVPKKYTPLTFSQIPQSEIPFDIPDNWKWVRLGEIGNWGSGSTPDRNNPKYYNGDIIWIKTGELNNSIVYDSEEKISEEALQKGSFKINKIGDVMIAMYGATIGKLGIAGAEMVTNQACCGCSLYGAVSNKYLFYYLMANKDRFIKMGAGGAQPNISRTKIIAYPIPLPPLSEQERIVAKLDRLRGALGRD